MTKLTNGQTLKSINDIEVNKVSISEFMTTTVNQEEFQDESKLRQDEFKLHQDEFTKLNAEIHGGESSELQESVKYPSGEYLGILGFYKYNSTSYSQDWWNLTLESTVPFKETSLHNNPTEDGIKCSGFDRWGYHSHNDLNFTFTKMSANGIDIEFILGRTDGAKVSTPYELQQAEDFSLFDDERTFKHFPVAGFKATKNGETITRAFPTAIRQSIISNFTIDFANESHTVDLQPMSTKMDNVETEFEYKELAFFWETSAQFIEWGYAPAIHINKIALDGNADATYYSVAASSSTYNNLGYTDWGDDLGEIYNLEWGYLTSNKSNKLYTGLLNKVNHQDDDLPSSYELANTFQKRSTDSFVHLSETSIPQNVCSLKIPIPNEKQEFYNNKRELVIDYSFSDSNYWDEKTLDENISRYFTNLMLSEMPLPGDDVELGNFKNLDLISSAGNINDKDVYIHEVDRTELDNTDITISDEVISNSWYMSLYTVDGENDDLEIQLFMKPIFSDTDTTTIKDRVPVYIKIFAFARDASHILINKVPVVTNVSDFERLDENKQCVFHWDKDESVLKMRLHSLYITLPGCNCGYLKNSEIPYSEFKKITSEQVYTRYDVLHDSKVESSQSADISCDLFVISSTQGKDSCIFKSHSLFALDGFIQKTSAIFKNYLTNYSTDNNFYTDNRFMYLANTLFKETGFILESKVSNKYTGMIFEQFLRSPFGCNIKLQSHTNPDYVTNYMWNLNRNHVSINKYSGIKQLGHFGIYTMLPSRPNDRYVDAETGLPGPETYLESPFGTIMHELNHVIQGNNMQFMGSMSNSSRNGIESLSEMAFFHPAFRHKNLIAGYKGNDHDLYVSQILSGKTLLSPENETIKYAFYEFWEYMSKWDKFNDKCQTKLEATFLSTLGKKMCNKQKSDDLFNFFDTLSKTTKKYKFYSFSQDDIDEKFLTAYPQYDFINIVKQAFQEVSDVGNGQFPWNKPGDVDPMSAIYEYLVVATILRRTEEQCDELGITRLYGYPKWIENDLEDGSKVQEYKKIQWRKRDETLDYQFKYGVIDNESNLSYDNVKYNGNWSMEEVFQDNIQNAIEGNYDLKLSNKYKYLPDALMTTPFSLQYMSSKGIVKLYNNEDNVSLNVKVTSGNIVIYVIDMDSYNKTIYKANVEDFCPYRVECYAGETKQIIVQPNANAFVIAINISTTQVAEFSISNVSNSYKYNQFTLNGVNKEIPLLIVNESNNWPTGMTSIMSNQYKSYDNLEYVHFVDENGPLFCTIEYTNEETDEIETGIQRFLRKNGENSLQGKLVIHSRGEESFVSKWEAFETAGAAVAMIYNSPDRDEIDSLGMNSKTFPPEIPYIYISNADSVDLFENLAQNESNLFNISQDFFLKSPTDTIKMSVNGVDKEYKFGSTRLSNFKPSMRSKVSLQNKVYSDLECIIFEEDVWLTENRFYRKPLFVSKEYINEEEGGVETGIQRFLRKRGENSLKGKIVMCSSSYDYYSQKWDLLEKAGAAFIITYHTDEDLLDEPSFNVTTKENVPDIPFVFMYKEFNSEFKDLVDAQDGNREVKINITGNFMLRKL